MRISQNTCSTRVAFSRSHLTFATLFAAQKYNYHPSPYPRHHSLLITLTPSTCRQLHQGTRNQSWPGLQRQKFVHVYHELLLQEPRKRVRQQRLVGLQMLDHLKLGDQGLFLPLHLARPHLLPSLRRQEQRDPCVLLPLFLLLHFPVCEK
jgi:hypothetical protein